ncbi:hypothetical protein [Helicobacter typhlonius]|uniref:hypothetical protein n=1 Tax=Helicobacter typhlonius TaxID=76936 RepID=UPI002FDF0B2E
MFLAITSNEPPKQFGKNSISLFSKRHIPSNALFINLGGGTSRNSLESVFCAFEAGFKIARANKSGVSAIKNIAQIPYLSHIHT